MNWLKILNDFEALVFQLAVLVLLAPKTLVKIATQPKWLPSYLAGEEQKDVEQRFDEYVSPILYWIIFSVVMLTVRVLFIGYIGGIIASAVLSGFGGGGEEPAWTDHQLDATKFSQAIMISLCYPLAFASVPVIWITRTVSRKSMKLPFYLQCYAFGTFVTLCTILELGLLFIGVGYFEIGSFPLNYVALSVCTIWIFWFQVAFLRRESVKIWAIAAIFLLSSITGTVLTYLTVTILLDIPGSILGG